LDNKFDPFEKYATTTMLGDLTQSNVDLIVSESCRYFAEYVLSYLPQDKKANILDVGCGYGRYLTALEKSGYINVKGIDISKDQVAYARNKLGLFNAEVADAIHYLEDDDQKYDAVLLMDVLEHLSVEDSVSLLAKIKQALRKGGVLIIHVPNALAPLSVHRYQDVTHQRAYTTASIEQSLRMAGGGFSSIEHVAVVWGVKSIVRRIIWSLLFNPMIYLYTRIAIGPVNEGIFTNNIMSVATRDEVI